MSERKFILKWGTVLFSFVSKGRRWDSWGVRRWPPEIFPSEVCQSSWEGHLEELVYHPRRRNQCREEQRILGGAPGFSPGHAPSLAIPDGPLLPVCPRSPGYAPPVACFAVLCRPVSLPHLPLGSLRHCVFFSFCSVPSTCHSHDKRSINIY